MLRGGGLCGAVRYECPGHIDETLPCYPESGESQEDAPQG